MGRGSVDGVWAEGRGRLPLADLVVLGEMVVYSEDED